MRTQLDLHEITIATQYLMTLQKHLNEAHDCLEDVDFKDRVQDAGNVGKAHGRLFVARTELSALLSHIFEVE